MKRKFDSITPEQKFLNRRSFMKNSSIAGLSLMASSLWPLTSTANTNAKMYNNIKRNSLYSLNEDKEKFTEEAVSTSYNNFYEFSLEKEEVKSKVQSWNLKSDSWEIEVSGLIENTKKYKLEDLISLAGGSLEERVYRFRCVEAWSMIVPWVGFPLSQLIEKLKPKKNAKFIKFYSLSDNKVMPNLVRLPQYPWPYTEGLTLEEAMNPLTLMATGLYKKELPKQNGAPIRLVVPWKYGFKSIKSIVKIEFTDKQPETLWNQLAPDEYGFYANVNPQVSHPRWSQATERVLDKSFFPKRKPTLMFNGYEKEVSYLYKNLDLKKYY